MKFDFPGVALELDRDALILRSDRPLRCLSSAIVGGVVTDVRTILNRHVDKGYDHRDPAGDLGAYARGRGIDGAFAGLMTVVQLKGARATDTSTDAVVIACTGRGEPIPYAGQATPIGRLIGRCVRQALQEAPDAYQA